MKPVRPLVFMAAAAALTVLSLGWWWSGDNPGPEPRLAVLGQIAHAQPPEPAMLPTTVQPQAAALLPSPPASAASAHIPPSDVSRMQREIQMAISSDQRGLAGKAARHIEACWTAEFFAAQFGSGSQNHSLHAADPDYRARMAAHERLLPACQAVDAASRAQLVPLLRRSLAEGDKGAAAALVSALGESFNVAAEPTAVAALRRDAWACDTGSLHWLSTLAAQHPRLLTLNEVGALREQRRAEISKATEETRRRADIPNATTAALESLIASFKPPPGADPAEVARMAADIQSRCTVER